MNNISERAAEAADAIEEEMRRIGMWQNEPLADDAYGFRMAFAMDTMAFGQWLQFILLPRVREIIREGGAFPASSSVAAQAAREFDGVPEASRLIELLVAFDALFNG